jgi:DNA-binding transcriptional LysR family regulator
MDFRQLKTFLKIVDSNSFTGAALALGYAQSTVTTQIKNLEEELNTPLFERIGKTICLTPEGKLLIPYARQVTQIERSIFNDLSPTVNLSGHLVIGAAESLCNLLVPKIIRQYKMNYPDVNVEIRFGNSGIFPELLKRGEIDVAFSIGKGMEGTDFVSYLRRKERMCLLVNPQHPLTKNKNVTLEIITQYPLLLTSRSCAYRSALTRMAADKSLPINIALETGNVQALKQFATSGIGITFLPYVAVQDSIESGELVELNWFGEDFGIISEVVYHKNKHIFPALEHLLSTIRDTMQTTVG